MRTISRGILLRFRRTLCAVVLLALSPTAAASTAATSNTPPATADFAIGAVTASRGQGGNPQLSAQVANTGGRALDITGELRLTGGLSAGPFSPQKP